MVLGRKQVYLIVAGAAVILALLAVAGFLFWRNPTGPSVVEPFSGPEESEGSTYGTLPETKSLTNPLENTPELNPIDKANPFKDVYKNPFE
ncbi:MAG: hypothetical protein G01um101430_222 [Parcubacteria group bacterium Gr01-1014_30]|nr:MAG: hypothetical protein G01um101430_222 [Parcubacteria group bacterium Gr01-1014_30]